MRQLFRQWIPLFALLLLLLPQIGFAAAANEESVLAELFVLNRSLEVTRGEAKRLAAELSRLDSEQAMAQAELSRLDDERKARLALFGRRARYYSEQGASASFSYLMASQTFIEFLGRLEMISWVMRRDATMLAELRQLKDRVAAQEAKLAAQRADVNRLQSEQQAKATKIEQDIGAREQLLESLQEQRAAVEEKLAAMERLYETTAKPILDSLGSTLKRIALNTKEFKPDSVKLNLVPPGVTVKMSEKSLTNLFSQQPELQGLKVRLTENALRLEGEFGGASLQIAGRFTIRDETIIRFEPGEMVVAGVTVPEHITEAMLAQGSLDVDVASFVEPWSIQEVLVEQSTLVIKAGMK